MNDTDYEDMDTELSRFLNNYIDEEQEDYLWSEGDNGKGKKMFHKIRNEMEQLINYLRGEIK